MNEPHLSRAWRPGCPADPLAGELCQDRCPDTRLNILQQLWRRQFTTIQLPNVYIKLTAAAALVVCIASDTKGKVLMKLSSLRVTK